MGHPDEDLDKLSDMVKLHLDVKAWSPVMDGHRLEEGLKL